MAMHSSEGRGQGERQGGEGRGERETEKGRGSERIQLEEQGAGVQRSSLKAPQGKLVLKIIITQSSLHVPCSLMPSYILVSTVGLVFLYIFAILL